MIGLKMCSNERIPDREQCVNNYENIVIKRSATLDFTPFSNISVDTSPSEVNNGEKSSLPGSCKKFCVM